MSDSAEKQTPELAPAEPQTPEPLDPDDIAWMQRYAQKPAAPVSSARPDRQTVEQKQLCRCTVGQCLLHPSKSSCSLRDGAEPAWDGWAIELRQSRYRKVKGVTEREYRSSIYKGSHTEQSSTDAFNRANAAINSEQADARPARTLKDYARHLDSCASHRCRRCSTGQIDHRWESCHVYHQGDCSCGLDTLLSGGAPHGR